MSKSLAWERRRTIKTGIISPKLQLISGHANERNLAIYRDLALVDVADEYESAMKDFPLK
jgi:hypothetical protein